MMLTTGTEKYAPLRTKPMLLADQGAPPATADFRDE